MDAVVMERITYSSTRRTAGGCRQCIIAAPGKRFFKKTTFTMAKKKRWGQIKCQLCKRIGVVRKIRKEKKQAVFEMLSRLKFNKTKTLSLVIIEECKKEEDEIPKEIEITQMETPTITENLPVLQSNFKEEEIQWVLEDACNDILTTEPVDEEMINDLLRTLETNELEPLPMELDEETVNQIFADLLRSTDEVENGHKYADQQERVASFSGWPCTYFTPQQMAAAGFYYTGEIDKVRCFECQTEICRWEPTDDPMAEHRRWGGRCMFLRQTAERSVPVAKGEDTCERYTEEVMASQESEETTKRSDAKLQCKICWAQEIEIVILPCGHAVCCVECARVLEKCAICRGEIERKIRTFFNK